MVVKSNSALSVHCTILLILNLEHSGMNTNYFMKQTNHHVEQAHLTQHYLQPHQAALQQYLHNLRQITDTELASQYPQFCGKPYPLGRCKEICHHMLQQLQQRIRAPQDAISQQLHDFIRAGGRLSLEWGSLRDEYFQNALLCGSWYIDVANDTVDRHKPKIEILPIAQANFRQIVDYAHFIRIAEPYWQVSITANNVCPALAPFFPLLCIGAAGQSWLAAAADYMIDLSRQSAFQAAEQILTTLPSPPATIKQRWQQQLTLQTDNRFFNTQQSAIDYCQQYRQQELHLDNTFRDQAVMAFMSLASAV